MFTLLQPTGAVVTESQTYKRRADFLSNDDYAVYVRENVQVSGRRRLRAGPERGRGLGHSDAAQGHALLEYPHFRHLKISICLFFLYRSHCRLTYKMFLLFM